MFQGQLEIREGVPPAQVAGAAAVLYEAFERKLRLFMGTPAQAQIILAESFNAARVLVALADGQLVGLAGLEYAGQPFIQPRLSIFSRHLGRGGGLFSWAILHLFNRKPPADELRVECLAVSAAARGQGVGTRLLEETFAFARRQGYRAVRLEVVDTNGAAYRLYERMGFVTVETHRYPYLRQVAGFAAENVMVKTL